MNLDEEIAALETTLATERAAEPADRVLATVKIQGLTEKLYSAMAQQERMRRNGDPKLARSLDTQAIKAGELKTKAARALIADELRDMHDEGEKDAEVRKKMSKIRRRPDVH